jgi:hypothetical protein
MMESGLAFVSFCCFSSTDKEQFIDKGSIFSGLEKGSHNHMPLPPLLNLANYLVA